MTSDELRVVGDALKSHRGEGLEALVERACESGDAEAQLTLAMALVHEAEHVCVDPTTDDVKDGLCPGYELVLHQAGNVLVRGNAPKHPIWPYAVGALQLAHRRLNGDLHLAHAAR